MKTPGQSTIPWRISSFSGNNGTCVEVAALPEGHIALRNSTHPDAGTMVFTRAQMNVWIHDIKAGKFDHLMA